MLKINPLQAKPAAGASHLYAALLGFVLLLPASVALADVLAVPGEEEGAMMPAPMDLPRRGIPMSQVEAEFGVPGTKHPAIGDPPITRWDYDGFSVFFEYQHVLHSVIPDKPQPIYNKEELQPGY